LPQAHSALVRPPLPRAALGAHQPVEVAVAEVAVVVVEVEEEEEAEAAPLPAGLPPVRSLADGVV
jgi:hypothetical protein